MTTMTATTTQVYQLFIRATPEQIWEAITKPEFTVQYFYGARHRGRPASATCRSAPTTSVWGDDAGAGVRPAAAAGARLALALRPELAAEKPSRVTWEIEPQDGGYCMLTRRRTTSSRALP